jgi:carboxypeptidase T
MKKPLIILSVALVEMLVLPSISATILPQAPSTGVLHLQMVREQRLTDRQNYLPAPLSNNLYRNYTEMTTLLESLATIYSDIMQVSSIGKTYQGRDLWMVKLSDNVAAAEPEPEVLFVGAHHGFEKPSYEVCLYFIEYMVDNYRNASTPEVGSAINTTQIYVLPMLNPDGVDAGVRKNCAPNHGFFGRNPQVTSYGVDLNRNYGYLWYRFFVLYPLYCGSTSCVDSSSGYRGPWAFSENETRALKQFVDTHDIKISISYHTYGELVLYPWGYTIKPPKDKPVFVSIGENITAIDDYYTFQSIRLYATIGDLCDWMYGTHGILAFTIEMGKSYAPDDPQVVRDLCVTHTRVNLYICQRAQTL